MKKGKLIRKLLQLGQDMMAIWATLFVVEAVASGSVLMYSEGEGGNVC